jgi:hypothetical protein
MKQRSEGEGSLVTDLSTFQRTTIQVSSALSAGFTHQKIETFNSRHNGTGLFIFPGIGDRDADRYVSGRSRTFNALLAAFPERHIMVGQWPTVYDPRLMYTQIVDYLHSENLTSILCWGHSFGGSVALGLAEYMHERGENIEIEGISTLVSPVTAQELKPIGQIRRTLALAAVKGILGLSFSITGQKPIGDARERIAKLRVKPDKKGDIDPKIPVQCMTTKPFWDPLVDSYQALAVLRALFETVHHVPLEGQRFVDIKGKPPFVGFNEGGHHASRRDMPTLQKELIAFLSSPKTYIAPRANQ